MHFGGQTGHPPQANHLIELEKDASGEVLQFGLHYIPQCPEGNDVRLLQSLLNEPSSTVLEAPACTRVLRCIRTLGHSSHQVRISEDSSHLRNAWIFMDLLGPPAEDVSSSTSPRPPQHHRNTIAARPSFFSAPLASGTASAIAAPGAGLTALKTGCGCGRRSVPEGHRVVGWKDPRCFGS